MKNVFFKETADCAVRTTNIGRKYYHLPARLKCGWKKHVCVAGSEQGASVLYILDRKCGSACLVSTV